MKEWLTLYLMSKSWWAPAFVFLNQQTVLCNVARAISQEVAGDPRLLALSWVKRVCPRQKGAPNSLSSWEICPASCGTTRLLTCSLNSHLACFIMKPRMESLKDICQRWIKQRTQHPSRTISSRVRTPGFILPTRHFPPNVQSRGMQEPQPKRPPGTYFSFHSWWPMPASVPA